MLTKEHTQYLMDHAIDIELAEALGVRSITSPEELPEELAHYGHALPGILFPWSFDGERSYPQLRPDTELVKADGSKLKYVFATADDKIRPTIWRVHDPERPDGVLLVEGTKQALAVASCQPTWTVYAIAGCWGWYSDGSPMVELDSLAMGLPLVALFDADLRKNGNVWDAACRLVAELPVITGADSVGVASTPGGRQMGIDDVLARRGEDQRLEYLMRVVDSAETRLRNGPRANATNMDDVVDAIMDTYAVAVDSAGDPYVYRDGVYVRDEQAVRAIAAASLGGAYRSTSLGDAALELLGARLVLADRRISLDRSTSSLVVVGNGLLEPRTGELVEHTPEHLSLTRFPVEYDPSATSPLFDAWLDEVTVGRGDEIMEALAGVLDAAWSRQWRAVFAHGPTRSGKSTLLGLMAALVGEDNTSSVTLHQLVSDKFAPAQLVGKVLNLAGEMSSSHMEDVEQFKQLTGDDLVTVQRKYGQPFAMRNRSLFLFAANTIPTVSELSGAYLARVAPFEFPNSYLGTEDTKLPQRLRAELPGILNHLVAGYQRVLDRDQWVDSPASRRAAEVFGARSDMVVLFLRSCTVDEQGATVPRSDLYATYKRWTRQQDRHPLGKQRFNERIRSLYPEGKNHGQVVWQDLRLLDESDWTEGLPSAAPVAVYEPKETPVAPADPEPTPSPQIDAERVVIDLETTGLDVFGTPAGEFIRLTGQGDVDSSMFVAMSGGRPVAEGQLVAHNGMGFDYLALDRAGSIDMLAKGDRGELLDTRVMAQLADPPPAGGKVKRGYYSLDTVAERLGVPGKTDDLKALADEFGGFDMIPVDDERYVAYLQGDVEATAAVFRELGEPNEYAMREHRVLSRLAAITLGGFRVDTELLTRRIEEGAERKATHLADLCERFGISSDTKAPLATKAGKEALAEAFADLGVTLPTTKSGAPSLGKDTLSVVVAQIEEGEPAHELAQQVMAVNGERTVYGTIRDHLVGDRVHPRVDARQASGRISITEPGLTVMGKRGGKHVEREVFLPDEGELLVAVDLDQIDARAIAAHCQDPAYLELFAPGRDLHAEVAQRVWGDRGRREEAKVLGHGWNYGMGVNGLARNAGVPMEQAMEFDQQMVDQFPDLVAWRDEVRADAEAGVLLDNGWGRLMRPDPERAWTQGPALMGQGAARDLMMEGLLRLDLELVRHLKAVVHDELVFSVPAADAQERVAAIIEAMTFTWRGVSITAGASPLGATWGGCY